MKNEYTQIDPNFKHDFIYEDKNIGRVLMREVDTNHTSIHRLVTEETPFHTIDAFWWDLTSIREHIAANKEEVFAKMQADRIGSCIARLEKISEDLSCLPKYSKARCKALISELIDEIRIGQQAQ